MNEKIVSDILNIASEISNNRVRLEFITKNLVDNKHWEQQIQPEFEKIKHSLNNIISTIFLKYNNPYQTKKPKL